MMSLTLLLDSEKSRLCKSRKKLENANQTESTSIEIQIALRTRNRMFDGIDRPRRALIDRAGLSSHKK